MAPPQRIIVPFTGQRIGDGFNSQTMTRVGTGLTVGPVGEDPVAPGQSAVFRFVMLTSQDHLEESLNFSAEIDARYGLFSGDAKFAFAESNSINRTSTYLLASGVIANALQSASVFTPTETVNSLVKSGDKEKFKAAFGDYFTQALHTGGELHILVRVTSSVTEFQQAISASLHAELNGLFAAVSFKAALEKAMSRETSHTEVTIEVYQTGGVGSEIHIPGTDADQVREALNRFAAAAHQDAKAYKAELVTYDVLSLPFPSEELLQDRREVLDDCLVRRRGYLSAISDLQFAQSPDGELIFENLPPKPDILALENAFRRVLNALMAHARGVSDGSIAPALFVADSEPVAPVFRRRQSGSFASWWDRATKKDPTLLSDERILIDSIAREAKNLLATPTDEPQAMEHAANQITSLALGSEAGPRLNSLALLPKMIEAPLRRVDVVNAALEDLSGLESFSRLELLNVPGTRLRDLRSLASIAGLQTLFVAGNDIDDLTALSALTELKVLFAEGNEIPTLEPLRNLAKLTSLSVAGERLSIGDEPWQFKDNPITDARALSAIPAFASCPLAKIDKVRVTIFDSPNNGFEIPVPVLSQSGTAIRIGDSNRFEFSITGGMDGEQLTLGALRQSVDLDNFPTPVVIFTLWFPSRGLALGVCQSDSVAISAQRIVDLYFDESQGKIQLDVDRLLGQLPGTLVELAPA